MASEADLTAMGTIKASLGAMPTANEDSEDFATQKETAAAQKLQRLARALREERDEQKRVQMALHAKYTLTEPYLPCKQIIGQQVDSTMGLSHSVSISSNLSLHIWKMLMDRILWDFVYVDMLIKIYFKALHRFQLLI